MKKAAFLALLILALSLFGCSGKKQANDNNSASDTGSGIVENTDNSDTDEIAVRNVVVAFGKKLQDVSLQSPNVKTDMKNSYGDLVSPELLKKWQDDPKKAPGKLVSSPWPDSIGIESVDRKEDKTYEVKGKIIEMTSAEQQSGGAAAKRDVSLEVKKDDGKWLITDVTLGEYENKAANENESTITYKNNDYGFDFALPQSWKGYKILTDKWEGLAVSDSSQGEKVAETGPEIVIRHPKWTKEKERQDIPIFVFTIKQWDALQKDKFHIGAAPIGPRELGRNSKYVFALPARYNYAFPEGYEEVDKILNGKPLTPTENFK